MKLSYQAQEYPLEFTFTISRSSSSSTRTIIIALEHDKYTGRGEAVFSRFYKESEESVTKFYDRIIKEKTLDKLDPFNNQDFQARMLSLADGTNHQAAISALDMAIYDLRCKILGLPLYKYLGLDPKLCPRTSYTIGIADLDTIRLKTEAALSRGYDILKVKLGCPDDLKIIELIRSLAPKATIRVDANAAWDLKAALEILQELNKHNIEFVEEPLKLDSSLSDYEALYAASPLPLMADESCHTLRDIPHCARYFHSINIKHTKSGGITEALRMISAARAHNLKIMLGCFTETSLSIAAFAHISPLVDYNDLDGSLLLAKDPHNCISFEANRIILSDRPGLG